MNLAVRMHYHVNQREHQVLDYHVSMKNQTDHHQLSLLHLHPYRTLKLRYVNIWTSEEVRNDHVL